MITDVDVFGELIKCRIVAIFRGIIEALANLRRKAALEKQPGIKEKI